MRSALLVDQRKYQSAQFGMIVVQQSMGSEMDDAIVFKLRTESGGFAGIEVERLKNVVVSGNRFDSIGLPAGER